MRKIRLLITSVGSLVGQNIFDVLESPYCPRRALTYIIGTNSIAKAANNFRCDKCYLVPPTASSDFLSQILEIIKTEQPDLVINARDADTYLIANLIKQHSNLKCKTIYGELEALILGLNKWRSYMFSQQHGLPFADTFSLNESMDIDDLRHFAHRAKYPLIAKPAEGFASTGVYFARNWKETKQLADCKDYVFQEYLGSGEHIESYFKLLGEPPPLFAHPTEICVYSSMTVIGSGGKLSPIYISMNKQRNGATVDYRKLDNENIAKLSASYANAYYKQGGCGPMNIQYSKNQEGTWKAFEINFRLVGLTYVRFLTGLDEIGLIIRDALPDTDFPIYKPHAKASSNVITKSLGSFPIPIDFINTLHQENIWSLNT